MVMSATGISWLLNSAGSENDPMNTSTRIGISVQAISIGVLWVKVAGVGLRLALNFHEASAISSTTKPVMAVASWKFNAKRNPKPASFTHHTPIEIAWTLIPILVLVFIGSFSLPALFKSQEIPVADITIKATANQWYWSYDYVDEGVTFDSYMIGAPATGGANMMTPEVEKQLIDAGYRKEDFLLATDTAVVIPIGKTIVVQVTATDVIHAWKIPAFGVMQDAVPGRLAHLWFTAEKEGIYFGQCSELCGQMHTYMLITVKVVSQEVYDTWLAAAKTGDLTLASN